MFQPERAAIKPRFMSSAQAFAEFETKMEPVIGCFALGQGAHAALTGHLYAACRSEVLAFWELDPARFEVTFGDARSLAGLRSGLRTQMDCRELHSQDVGLALGVGALACPRCSMKTRPPAPSRLAVFGLAKALSIIRQTRDPLIFKRGRRLLSLEQLSCHHRAAGKAGHVEELRQALMGRDSRVPVTAGHTGYCHLAYHSATPALQPAWEAWRANLRLEPEALSLLLEHVRERCHAFFDAPEGEYICLLTQGRTDSLAWAEENARLESRGRLTSIVFGSLVGEAQGGKRAERGTLADGDRQALKRRLQAGGVGLIGFFGGCGWPNGLEDLGLLARLAHAYHAQLLVDASRWAGRVPLSLRQSGIDYLLFSGRGLYAPFGAAGILVRKAVLSLPSQRLQAARSASEANAAAVAGLGQAMEALQRVGLGVIAERVAEVSRYARARLQAMHHVRLEAPLDADDAISFTCRGVSGLRVARWMAEQAGMGVDQDPARRGLLGRAGDPVRISFGLGSTAEHVDQLCRCLAGLDRYQHSQRHSWLGRRCLPPGTESYARDFMTWMAASQERFFAFTPEAAATTLCRRRSKLAGQRSGFIAN